VAADVLGMQGKVGAIVPGAYGDMVGVDGDPLDRLELLATPDRLPLVVKGGSVVKSPLH
jgi:imidazolonepropionase-like amidohydrolase